jgi:hypothetical protein
MVAALAAVALTALTDTPSRAGPISAAKGRPPLVGIVWSQAQQRLVRVNPNSLRALPRSSVPRVALDGHTNGWSFSPNGSRLVLGRDGIPELRFVDVLRQRRLGQDLEIGDWQAAVAATGWFRSDLLVAVLAQPGCCSVGTTTVVWIDPIRRQVLRRQVLDGALVRVAKTSTDLVLLLAPPSDSETLSPVGPSRLAVVNADGARIAPLDIVSGVEHGATASDPNARITDPALAVDAARAVAYVVAADGEVDEVELGTLTVRTRHPVLAGRRLAAPAKEFAGSERHAVVLPDGAIAVSGSDFDTTTDSQGQARVVSKPAGLRLVEPSGWSVRMLDGQADYAQAVGDELVATGPGIGVEAFGADGARHFRLLSGRRAWVEQAYGSRLFVQIDSSKRLKVVDVARRRVVGERKHVPPWLLVDGAWNPWS